MDSAFATFRHLPAGRAACQRGPVGLPRAKPRSPGPGSHGKAAAIVSQPRAHVTSIAAVSLALLSACGSSSPPPAAAPCPTTLLLKGAERTGSMQEMTVHMPGVTPAVGPQYSVFVGFQLDEAEVRRRLELR